MADKQGHVVVSPGGEKFVLVPQWVVKVILGVGIYIAILLTVLLILVIPSLGTNNSQDERIQVLTVQNRTALCAFREDLQRRVDSSREFLKEHPDGLPGVDISAAQIKHEIENQERTIGAFVGLSCKRLPPPTPRSEGSTE